MEKNMEATMVYKESKGVPTCKNVLHPYTPRTKLYTDQEHPRLNPSAQLRLLLSTLNPYLRLQTLNLLLLPYITPATPGVGFRA